MQNKVQKEKSGIIQYGKFFQFFVLFCIFAFFPIFHAKAGSCSSVATGAWATGATWSGTCAGAGGIPIAGDNATITGGYTVTVGANAAAATVTIDTSSTLSVGAFTLSVSGDTAITGTLSITSTTGTKTFSGNVTVNTGGIIDFTAAETMTIGGNLILSGTISGSATGIVTVTSGTLTVPASTTASVQRCTLTIGGTSSISGTLSFDTATQGNKTFTGDVTVNTGGTITFAVAETMTMSGNLILSGTISGSATGVVTVTSGTLTVPTSTTASVQRCTLTIGGTSTITGTLNFETTATGTKTFTGAVTVQNGGQWNEKTTTTINLSNNLTIDSGGTWSASAISPTTISGDVTVNGTWNETAAVTVSVGGNFTNNATSWTTSTGVHTFSGTTKTLSGSTETVIPSTTVSGTYTNSGTLTVSTALAGAGTLTNGNGSTGTLNLGMATVGITGLTATATGNTVNYNRSNTQTVFNTNYYNLTLSGTSAKTLQTGTTAIGGNLTLSGTASTTTVVGLTVSGNVSVGAGTTLTVAGYDLTVTGTTTVTGASSNLVINSATGTKTFNGLVTVDTSATWNNSGNSAVTFHGGITYNGSTFTAGSGVYTFDTGSQAVGGSSFTIPSVTVTGVTFTNNITAAGGFIVSTALSGTGGVTQATSAVLKIGGTSGITTLTATASGNTVDFNGTGAQTVPAFNYNNLTISGARTTNSITLASSGTVGVAGTFSPTATFTSGAYVVTGSTVDFNGTGAQTVPAFNYNNLTISGTRTTNSVTLASSGTIGVASTFSPTATFTSGSYVITGSTVDFNGSGSQTIPAFNYNNLTSSPAPISITKIQSNSSQTTSVSLTGVTAGNLIAILMKWEEGEDADASISDGTSTLSKTVRHLYGTGQPFGQWFYLTSANSGNRTYTATLPSGATFARMFVWEFNNSSGGFAYDTQNGTGSAVRYQTSGDITTFNGSTVVFGGYSEYTTATRSNHKINELSATEVLTESFTDSWYRVFSSTFTGHAQVDLNVAAANVVSTVSFKGTSLATARTLASSGTIGVAGTFTPGSSSYTVTGSTVDFNNATGSQTIPAFTFNNLTLSNTSGTDTAGGNVVVNGTLVTTASGTFDMTSAYTLSGTLGTITNNGTISTAVPTATSATPLASGKTWSGSGTVSYVAATAQTVVAGTYNTLDVKPAGNSITTVFEAGTITVNGNLTIGNGTNTSVIVSATGNDPNITVAGNVTVSANTTLANSDLNTATLNIDGNLTITGTFTAPVGTGDTAFTLGGNFTNNGTFNDANGRLVIDGTGTSALTYSANTTFHDLKIATAGKTIQFDEAQATIIESGGNFIVQGTNCTTDRVFLDSYVDNNAWDITVTGATLDIDYADIEDSNGTGSPSADNSTAENGGNTGWTVNAGACGGNQNPNSPASLTQKNGSDVAITESAWTASNTPKLGFTITDPDSDTVKYEVQVATDSGFSSLVLDYTHGSLSASGTVFTFVVGTYGSGSCTGTCPTTLSDSATGYWWRVKAIDEHDASSANVEFGVAGTVDFKVDATAPTGGSVYDGTSGDQDWNDGSLTQISGNWTGFNTDVSGLSKYEYAIRRKPDDYYWSICSGAGAWQAGANWCDNTTSTSFTQNTLNLSTGVTYYISVRTTDNAGNVETAVDSNGQQVLPLLSFSLSGNTVAFNNLNAANSYTDTKTITTTTSTNASNGYTIKVYNTDALRSTGVPTATISDFSGTWSTPVSWGGGQYGFGYTSNDTSVQGSNRFSGGTAFAAFTQTPPGDVVADHTDTVNGTTGAISNQQFTITYKVAASTSQAALYYQTTSIFIVTANY